MFTTLLAEALAVTADNLNMTATLLDCAQEAAVELSPEAQQRLNLIKVALAMALQAMNHDELRQVMEQSDSYVPEYLSLI
jgi:hypothetical protein